MKYREHIAEEMGWLAGQRHSVFTGEGIINAGRMYNTLDMVPLRKCIEYPIAENLIASSAIGLALEGFRPIVVFQRMDFMLIAADAIINHMALIPQMSGGKVKLPIVIRAIIGSRDRRFDVGPQHNHDFTHIFEPYLATIKYEPGAYKGAYMSDQPTLVIEDKDKYETNYIT